MGWKFLCGLLVVMASVFALCLYPTITDTTHTWLPDQHRQQQFLPQQQPPQTQRAKETQGSSFLPSHQLLLHNLSQSFLDGKLQLISRVLITNPPHEGRSETNYGLNLRFGYINWTDGLPLLKDPVDYQPDHKPVQEVQEFLARKHLMDTPLDTDVLSPYLSESRQVVEEAKRVHANLFRDLFRGVKYAVLFAFASFENKGDGALSIAELMLLENMGIKLLFYVNYNKCLRRFGHVQHAVNITSQYPRNEVIILHQAGGNLFSNYHVDRCRELVLRLTPSGYRHVLLPNSVWLRDTRRDFHRTLRIYAASSPSTTNTTTNTNNNHHLTMMLRDRLSLTIARRLFGADRVRLVLCPDLAFQLGSVGRYAAPYYDVLWQRRSDHQNALFDEVPHFPGNVSVHVFDWLSMASLEGNSSVEKAMHITHHGLAILQRGRVVVTDRLHGHILSTLLDIPHVLLDNQDHKLSSFHNTWTRGIGNCRLAGTAPEARLMALELLERYKDALPKRLSAVSIPEDDLSE